MVSRSFTYEALPQRVVFGAGCIASLPAELQRLGVQRALVLSTEGQQDAAAEVVDRLGRAAGGMFAGAVMHTPTRVTELALATFREFGCDATVAVGGGSTIGLGKALALRTDCPQIVLPTTYAGSEVTPILGQTEDGTKTTLKTPKVLPEVVIYDVDLTLTLPPKLSATSGMNAVAHAVEALYAQDANPIVSLMAEEGIRAVTTSLPRVIADPRGIAARSEAQYGAWLCGSCLGLVGMALHHKICHALGGTFDLPHAETHAIILPHAAAYNAPAAPEALGRVARAIGADDAGQGLYDLSGTLGIPRALRDIGMPADGIDKAVALITQSPYWNPRPVEPDAIRRLLQRAFVGLPPAAE